MGGGGVGWWCRLGGVLVIGDQGVVFSVEMEYRMVIGVRLYRRERARTRFEIGRVIFLAFKGFGGLWLFWGLISGGRFYIKTLHTNRIEARYCRI